VGSILCGALSRDAITLRSLSAQEFVGVNAAGAPTMLGALGAVSGSPWRAGDITSASMPFCDSDGLIFSLHVRIATGCRSRLNKPTRANGSTAQPPIGRQDLTASEVVSSELSIAVRLSRIRALAPQRTAVDVGRVAELPTPHVCTA
jgi:hypothetical protein